MIEELREIEAKATPGPWRQGSDPHEIFANYDDVTRYRGRVGLSHDAALIVAMRNALPELLAAAEATGHTSHDDGGREAPESR